RRERNSGAPGVVQELSDADTRGVPKQNQPGRAAAKGREDQRTEPGDRVPSAGFGKARRGGKGFGFLPDACAATAVGGRRESESPARGGCASWPAAAMGAV